MRSARDRFPLTGCLGSNPNLGVKNISLLNTQLIVLERKSNDGAWAMQLQNNTES